MTQGIADVTEATFDQDVIASTQPVLVEFWGARCIFCDFLHPVLEEIAGTHADRMRVAKVNADSNEAIRTRFAVRGLPTVILFKGGAEAGRFVGAKSITRINEFVDQHL
jgi:thioredoxin 1